MQKLKVIAPGQPWIALMKDRGRSIIEYDMGFAMPPLDERAVDRLRTYLEDYQHANSRALTRTTPKVGPSDRGGSVEAHEGECGSPLHPTHPDSALDVGPREGWFRLHPRHGTELGLRLAAFLLNPENHESGPHPSRVELFRYIFDWAEQDDGVWQLVYDPLGCFPMEDAALTFDI